MDLCEIAKEELAGADGWRFLLFSIGCAQQVEPIVNVLATNSTRVLIREVLDNLWLYCFEERKIDFGKIISDIENTSEASEDDSHKPAYFVSRALGIIVDALNCANNIDNTNVIDGALSACDGMLDIMGDMDFVIEKSGEVLVESLETSEVAAQKTMLRLIASASEDKKKTVCSVKDFAKEASKLIASALPVFQRGHGWI